MAYKQLTQDLRYQIYAMNQVKMLQEDIAAAINVSASTISRELKRNVGKLGFYVKKAHEMALEKRQGKSKYRITAEDWRTIEDYLRDDVSPEQISLRLKHKKQLQISHEWIYQYIYEDKSQGGNLYKHLRCKKKNKKEYGKKRHNSSIKGKVSIENRPKIVDSRRRYGDWEADTIIGRQGGAVLVTLVERKSKLCLIGWSGNKKSESVKEVIIKLLASFSAYVHTLTYDNGPEFAKHKEVDKALNSQGYFAHPFCSGERGLNENTNGLIRQYLPKRTSFDDLTKGGIQWIIDKLNNRPRKALEGKTPNEVFFSGNRIALSC